MSPPTQYRLSGILVQVRRPNQQYQSTEGKDTTTVKKTPKRQTTENTINRNTYNPLVYNNTVG